MKHQKLKVAEVLKTFKRYQILAYQTSTVLARPASRLDFGTAEIRLGKPA
jgi:hypothetical protein